nr:hypothetical protein [Tanacetum cinerariifolium]
MYQVEELEREVTYEVKKAVSNYGENKSSVVMVTHLSSFVVLVQAQEVRLDLKITRGVWFVKNVCGKVGTLADVYIAKRKNHLGQMFAFCRYIKVANSKTLIDSLSKVWIRKLHLHANVAKFDRNVSIVPSHVGEKVRNNSQPNKGFLNGVMNMGAAKSFFSSVLNAGRNSKSVMAPPPPIVLGDDCILQRDFSCILMGKIKDINALSNLYVILANEGFDKVYLTYLGGFWVLIDAGSSTSEEKLLKHMGVASWFAKLLPAINSFVSDERLVRISIEGLPIKTWTHNTFAKIISPWGVMADIDTTVDDPALPFKKFNDVSDNSCSDEEFVEEDVEHVSDACDFQNVKEVDHVLESSSKQDSKGDDPTFPPGFTPNAIDDTEVENMADSIVKHKGNSFSNKESSSSAKGGSNRSLKLKFGGSILDVMEGLVESAKKNWIRELNSNPSVGYSGGLLCIWDPNLFSKDSVTISHSFVAIQEDFNEVRSEHKIFGTNFNASGANDFNQFISTTGLVDLPVEDHKPILMRDLVVDYGPIPFRVFHSWFIKDGFEKLVEECGKIQLFVLVDGDRIEEPSKVKNEFLTNFSNLFSKPIGPSVTLDPQMFMHLSFEQNVDLESNVSYEEIKKWFGIVDPTNLLVQMGLRLILFLFLVVQLSHVQPLSHADKTDYNEDADADQVKLEDVALESGDISTLNSLVGNGIPQTLQLCGTIGLGNTHVLIDIESTHNFVQPGVVERMKLAVSITKPFKVYIGSGETLLYENICSKVGINMQEIAMEVDLYVLMMNEMLRRQQQQQIATNAKIQRRLWDPNQKDNPKLVKPALSVAPPKPTSNSDEDADADQVKLEDVALESGDISTLNSLVGNESPQTLQLCGTIGLGNIHVLIDNESIYNFVQSGALERMKLAVSITKPFKVYIGSGKTLLYENICSKVGINMQGIAMEVD